MGFYQLGMHSEAIEPMERAIELEPKILLSMIIWDVLWKIGRKREAYFQWKNLLFNYKRVEN